MGTNIETKCDRYPCEHVRGSTNKWFLLKQRDGRLIIEGYTYEGSQDHPVMVLCGASCLSLAISALSPSLH